MCLNDGFSETFIFMVKGSMFKAVLDFDKKTFTVYDNKGITHNGRILIRMKKLSQMKMNEIRKQLNDYIKDGKKIKGFTPPFGGRLI